MYFIPLVLFHSFETNSLILLISGFYLSVSFVKQRNLYSLTDWFKAEK